MKNVIVKEIKFREHKYFLLNCAMVPIKELDILVNSKNLKSVPKEENMVFGQVWLQGQKADQKWQTVKF